MPKEKTRSAESGSTAPVIHVRELCGSMLADGENGLAIRHKWLEPMIGNGAQKIVIDFSGVELATSSWLNAFIGGAVLDHGFDLLKKIDFVGCNDVNRESILIVIETIKLGSTLKNAPPIFWR